jgi:YqaJ-like viral recombinase domain
MGKDEKALLRLWREKRGEEIPLDLSGVPIVQLGLVTENLNRRWYELNSGHRISDIQRYAIHRTMPWMAATLDGLVKETGAVFEAKFVLPWCSPKKAQRIKVVARRRHACGPRDNVDNPHDCWVSPVVAGRRRSGRHADWGPSFGRPPTRRFA